MYKKIIIIVGYLASGKSTFALQLSSALNIPYLNNSHFPIRIYRQQSICKNPQKMPGL